MELRKVYVSSTNIISPLGLNTKDNFDQVSRGNSGISEINNSELYTAPFQGALIPDDLMTEIYKRSDNGQTRLEALFMASIKDALSRSSMSGDLSRTVLILSSTKGNVDLLKNSKYLDNRVFLYSTSKAIASRLGIKSTPLMVSSACISGVLALNMAARLIESGQYDHAIVSGADIISEFVVSGFGSLMAISDKRCKPYDSERNGINLGEGCGTIILSKDADESHIQVLSGFTSNDANHISGPSRTGEGLLNSIEKTFNRHNKAAADIDLLNAHGTATLFNDDMESKAFKQAGLQNTPTHSLKAYYGHTLGAAGLIESVISLECIKENMLVKSLGFDKSGTTESMNIIKSNENTAVNTVLKTASGFGGCNAAIIFDKENG